MRVEGQEVEDGGKEGGRVGAARTAAGREARGGWPLGCHGTDICMNVYTLPTQMVTFHWHRKARTFTSTRQVEVMNASASRYSEERRNVL